MTCIIASCLPGLAGAWSMSRYAYRFGLLDIPNDRSSHNFPTPLPLSRNFALLLSYHFTQVLYYSADGI
jgi:hypothetical protein